MGQKRKRGPSLAYNPKKKKAKSRKLPPCKFGSAEDEPNKPWWAEWKKMEEAEAFDTGKHRYTRGCEAILRSSDGPYNEWVARICSIRRRTLSDGTIEHWILVRWFYSSNDIRRETAEDLALNDMILGAFSRNERVISDVYDIVSTNTLKGTTRVFHYNEESVNPPAIDPERGFFMRHIFTTDPESVPSPQIIPFPGEHTCNCYMPYNPWPEEIALARIAAQNFHKRKVKTKPTEVERRGDYMHFCPRPACSTWFHESCLIEPICEDDFIASPDVRRLAVDPDRSRPCPQLAKYAYEKPPRGKMAHDDRPQTLSDILSAFEYFVYPRCPLPDSLITVAAMPIVRRAGEGTFSVQGNVADVVLARRLVYQALDGWHDEFKRLTNWLDDSWYDGARDRDVENHVWRFLNSVRILASPRAEYWDELVQKLEVHGDRPVLHCPNCTKDNLPVAI